VAIEKDFATAMRHLLSKVQMGDQSLGGGCSRNVENRFSITQ